MTSTKRELLLAFQYLLIGLAALAVTLHWAAAYSPRLQIAVWIVVAVGLSLLRLFLLLLNEWVRGNRWQTIRRRNWD